MTHATKTPHRGGRTTADRTGFGGVYGAPSSYSPTFGEGVFSEVRQKVSINAPSVAVDQGVAGCYNIVVEPGSPVSPLQGGPAFFMPLFSGVRGSGILGELRLYGVLRRLPRPRGSLGP